MFIYCAFYYRSLASDCGDLFRGTAPVLARLLREKLETMLPTSLGKWRNSLWRHKVKETLTNMRERKRFWEKVSVAVLPL